MKKSLLLLFFSVLFCVIAFSQFCNNDAPKISFTGKAPSPWAINGQIKDWQTILGPYSGNVFRPFFPPFTSGFNWVLDIDRCLQTDRDAPLPESDLHFLSFIHDDYNVYFYFRRQLNGNSPNTFYYFIDVNADGVMSLGEPVINASFNKKSVSPLTLGLYIPNRDDNYSEEKKGNFMSAQSHPFGVNNFPMPGNVVDIFNSNYLFGYTKLKKKEIFKAAVTEDGYGIELAIPWRFLRNWLSLKKSSDPEDIFFYKVSMQEGGGRYREEKVVDNAGSCLGGLGVSGNVDLAKSITTTVVNPGSAYKFNFSYTNSTNAATEVELHDVLMNFKKNSELPVNINDFTIKIYPDYNCNGTVDPGETGLGVFGVQVFFNAAQNTYSVAFLTLDVGIILPPFGKTCYNVDLTLPPNGVVNGFKISFESVVSFVEDLVLCDCCGGKPINQVGIVEEEVGEVSASVNRKSKIAIESVSSDDVLIYPNPNNGNTTIKIPQNAGGVDIMLEDNLGRNIKQWKSFKANILQVYNLKSGFYIVRMKFKETGKWVTKKIVVQR